MTLGCPKNAVDSDKIAAALGADGLTATDDVHEADVVVVNTCAFIEDARRESVDTILALSDLTHDGDAWFLDVPVPGADLDDVGVSITDHGDLVVDLGPHRRVIALPSVLRRCDVSGATLDLTDHGQVVRVRFDPVVDRWTAAVAR